MFPICCSAKTYCISGEESNIAGTQRNKVLRISPTAVIHLFPSHLRLRLCERALVSIASLFPPLFEQLFIELLGVASHDKALRFDRVCLVMEAYDIRMLT